MATLLGYGFPSATNVRTPTDDLAKFITTYFTRDVASFALNRWTQIIPSPTLVGYYKRFDPANPARVISNNDGLWPRGQPAPTGANNLQAFTRQLFECQRRERTWAEDKDTIDLSADVDLEASNAMMVNQQRATLETKLCTAALENTNWGTNTSSVDGGLLPAGQNFANGTADEPHIMDALGQAMVRVGLSTYSKVQPADLIVVCNPNTARRMAIAPELHVYLAQSQFALDSLTGKLSNGKANSYSLPPVLNHGLEVEVDDAAYEPTHEGELRTPMYVIPDGTIYLVSRKGGIEGAPGTGTYATVIRIYYGAEDQYESQYDEWQKMYQGRTLWDADYQVSSVLTGFRLTDVFGDAA